MDREMLGQILNEMREDRNLSQRELSEKSGVSVNYIRRVENGKNNVTVETLEMILKVLGVSLSDFFKISRLHQR